MLELVNFAVLVHPENLVSLGNLVHPENLAFPENLVHSENLAFPVYLESEEQGIDDRSIDYNLYKENILTHYTFKNHLFTFKIS